MSNLVENDVAVVVDGNWKIVVDSCDCEDKGVDPS